MFRFCRRFVLVWMVCIGIAVYAAPDIPRRHLKNYLATHQRPQYEYADGRIPMGVQAATLALQTLDRWVPSNGDIHTRGGNALSLSNPQDAFFRSSAEATPAEFIQQWNDQYAGRATTAGRQAVQIGPAVHTNPFAN